MSSASPGDLLETPIPAPAPPQTYRSDTRVWAVWAGQWRPNKSCSGFCSWALAQEQHLVATRPHLNTGLGMTTLTLLKPSPGRIRTHCDHREATSTLRLRQTSIFFLASSPADFWTGFFSSLVERARMIRASGLMRHHPSTEVKALQGAADW